MDSISLKAKLLSKLGKALPADPVLYPEPFSSRTAREVESSQAKLCYYERLLYSTGVTTDNQGHLKFTRKTKREDADFLCWLLRRSKSDDLSPFCPASSISGRSDV
jgi:hypothetical protein